MRRTSNALGQTRTSTDPRFGRRFRAITTDLWYTLIYYRPKDQRRLDHDRIKIWTDPLSAAGLARSRAYQELRRMDRWARRLEARGRTPSIREQARWLERFARAPIDGAQIADQLDALVARSPVRVAPGARRALAAIRAGGIPLGLVSNLLHETGQGARDLLDSLGILGEFSVLVFSDEHAWSKPAPAPFRFALSRLRVSADRAAHVGDLSYDVIGATRAGMDAFLYTGLHRWEPANLRELARAAAPASHHVARWSDLPDLVLGSRPK